MLPVVSYGMHIERVFRDYEHFSHFKPKLDSFFVNCILPRVLRGTSEDAAANKENVPSNELGDGVYCFCRRGEYGRMIACDNPQCKYEWFHFDCVSLTVAPKGKWYCSRCKT